MVGLVSATVATVKATALPLTASLKAYVEPVSEPVSVTASLRVSVMVTTSAGLPTLLGVFVSVMAMVVIVGFSTLLMVKVLVFVHLNLWV